MKWRNIYILTCITFFGKISYAIPLTRQNNFHRHYHVHKPEIAPKKEGENNAIEDTIENIVVRNITRTHRHNATLTNKKHRTKLENEMSLDEEIRLKNKGFFKLSKRLRFKYKSNPNIRQHAAKSIHLDCTVKGVSDRKRLSIKWIKDGISISGYNRR